jgi:hypothetical protein
MKGRSRDPVPASDRKAVLKEVTGRLDLPTRRLFLRSVTGFGTLSLLGGCDVVDGDSADRMLGEVSDFNDRVQAWLFSPAALAREYPESAITRPFPFNSFYQPNSPEKAPSVDQDRFRLGVSGLVEKNRRLDARSTLRVAEFQPDYPPHLHRRLERRRQVAGRSVLGVPQAGGRRYLGEIRDVPMRRQLYHIDRHADRPSSPNPAGVLVRR